MSSFVRAAALALCCLAPDAFAQSATLNGFVRDASSGETLIQATVVVEGPVRRGAATNTQGFYTVGSLPAGRYGVTVSYIGFQTVRDTVELAADATRRLDVDLQPEGVAGAEVVVEADESIEEERAVGVQEVSIQLIEKLPTVFEKDLFRSIQLLPGVKSSSDFSSKLYIRGGSPDQTLILLDGTTVYNPTHFFGFFSTFNTEAIKDVKLYKGAYPSQYGGRLGSVIDIYNRDGNRNRTAGTLSVGVLASRAGVEGPIAGGKGSYMVAARRSTLEPLLSVLRENLDQDGIPSAFYFYDVNAKVGLDLSPNDRVSLSGYAGRDKVTIPITDDSNFDLDYGNRTLSAAYNRVVTPTTFAQARATFSRYFSYPFGEIAGTNFERPNTITDYSGRLDLEWFPSEAFELKTGAWGGYFDLRLESRFNGATQIDFRSPATYASGYVQGRYKTPSGFIFTGGLRADHFNSITDDRTTVSEGQSVGYTRLSPQVQVEKTFGEDLVLQAAAGQYHQFLSLISNEAFSGFDTWVTTGAGVPPQASEQVVLGLKTRLGEAYRLDVEVYGRTLRELFDTDPRNQDVSGLDYDELFRFGEGYAYGLEVLVEKGVGRLGGLVGYTLGVTRRRYPGEGSFAEYFPPKYDRLHDLTLVTNYDLGRGWTATGAASYATGQAYSLPAQRYTVSGFPFGDTSFDGLRLPGINQARLPAYHRADVGVTKTGRFFLGGDYELQAQLVNVYNRRNLWFIVYDFDENPVEQTEVKQLPIIPNVSLSLSF